MIEPKKHLTTRELVPLVKQFYQNKISPFDAFLTAETLSHFEEPIWLALLTLLNGQEPDDLAIAGFSYRRFCQQGCDGVTALINLDWLSKCPQMAIPSLTWLDQDDFYQQTLY